MTTLDRPYLSRVVGYPNVTIKAAFVDLPGGGVIELLDYQVQGVSPIRRGRPTPTTSISACAQRTFALTGRRLSTAGARPISPDGPVAVDGGPNIGAFAAYLRIHDGITLELFQPPPPKPAS